MSIGRESSVAVLRESARSFAETAIRQTFIFYLSNDPKNGALTKSAVATGPANAKGARLPRRPPEHPADVRWKKRFLE